MSLACTGLHSTLACTCLHTTLDNPSLCYIFIYPRFPEGRLCSAALCRELTCPSSDFAAAVVYTSTACSPRRYVLLYRKASQTSRYRPGLFSSA